MRPRQRLNVGSSRVGGIGGDEVKPNCREGPARIRGNRLAEVKYSSARRRMAPTADIGGCIDQLWAGDAKLAAYVESVFQPEDDVLSEVRERSKQAGLPEIQVGKLDGLLLEVLARATGGQKAVEIGSLGGYSGICLLRGLGPQGILHTCEISPEHAQVARESFAKAGLTGQAKIHVGPANETLLRLEGEGPFDLCFIDADKQGYPQYLKWAAVNLKVGGVVLADNTFAWGEVATGNEPGVVALREFNQALARDPRFRSTIVPTAEGLTMGVKLRN